MKRKKSQGLPITVIVIAAISLFVLVVLLTIFTDTTRKTVENIGSCITKGGECADKLPGGKCGGDYPIPFLVSGDCSNTKPKNLCCIRAGTDTSQKEVVQTTDKRKQPEVMQI